MFDTFVKRYTFNERVEHVELESHGSSPVTMMVRFNDGALRAMIRTTQQKSLQITKRPCGRACHPLCLGRFFIQKKKKTHQGPSSNSHAWQASLPPSTKRIQLSSCSDSLGIRKRAWENVESDSPCYGKTQRPNGEHAVNPNQAATHSIFQVLYVFINCVTIDDGYVFLGIYQGFSFCCIVEGFQQK